MKQVLSILIFCIGVQIFFQYKLSTQISELSPPGQYLGCSTIINFIILGILALLLWCEWRKK